MVYQASAELGVPIEELYSAIAGGELAAEKVRGVWRVRRDDLDRWWGERPRSLDGLAILSSKAKLTL